MGKSSFRILRVQAGGWLTVVVALALIGALRSAAALTAGASYTVVLSKVNSDGTVTDVSSTSATADSNGKITFTLSNVPTTSEADFVVLTIKDASGKVVRVGVAPAPPPGSSSLVGVNGLATAQAKAVLKALELAGSDDPVLAGFAMVMVRAPGLASQDVDDTSTDLYKLAAGLKDVIRGTGGFVEYLTNGGVSAGALATFRSRIVYNPASGRKHLGDYVSRFKEAVDAQATQGSAEADDIMAEAGAFLADILVDAADAAGIDLALVEGAFHAAGDVVGQSPIASIKESVMRGMNGAVMGFLWRFAAMRLTREYTGAITTLGGSPQHAAAYSSAVNVMITGLTGIDKRYADYWMDPDTYVSDYMNNNTITDKNGDGNTDVQDAYIMIEEAIDQEFSTVWRDFQQAIRASDADVSAMRQAIASALGVPESNLPNEVGKDVDWSSGNLVSWPIPKVVAFTFAARHLDGGGTLSYTRGTEPIPDSMDWFDPDNDGTPGPRTDFLADNDGDGQPDIPPAFAALMGMEEDVLILTFRHFDRCRNAADPYQCEKLALKDFVQSLAALAGRVGGVTADQARALIKLMQEPNF